MPTKERTPFIYFEAKPKRGNEEIVRQTVAKITDLYIELYELRANCKLHTELKGNMWTVLITYELEEDREVMNRSDRFQEFLTDLRMYCKPAHRVRHMLYSILQPARHQDSSLLDSL